MLTYAPPIDVVHGRDDMDIQKAGFLLKQTSGSIRKWKEYYFRLGRLSLLCYRKDTDVRNGKDPKFKVKSLHFLKVIYDFFSTFVCISISADCPQRSALHPWFSNFKCTQILIVCIANPHFTDT